MGRDMCTLLDTLVTKLGDVRVAKVPFDLTCSSSLHIATIIEAGSVYVLH